ncbi:male gametophyte-specific2 [Zea mays]|uniref:Male gametophyte-specific2 n=1 Tax=Zea mays TaxID=4577 RepID=A0A1D6QQI8_MAIZE|nr:male gametophyte-specific2 [Zea mays]
METTTKLRWSRPGSFLLVAAAFLASAAASGVNVGQFDDHLQKRKELAEASAREAYRPDPYNVTNSFNAAVHRAVSSSRRRHLPLLRHQRLDRPHLHVQLRGRPHRRRAELHGDHHLQLPLHQPQRRHALRRQRLLAAGPDHADHRRLQPLRQGPGAADAKVPLGLLPRCQQRLHALAHVRHWRRRRANHHQPGQPLHSTTKHRRQSDHQALRGRRRVEELGVAHGGRPVHERRHLQSVRRRPQAGRHQRVGQAQARNLRYKAHPLLRHTVLLHGQAVLKAGRWASEAASSSSWPGHARSRWLRFISWKKARMDHRLSFC